MIIGENCWHSNHGELVGALDDVVGLDDGGEQRKAVLCVERSVEIVLVHPRQLNFISRLYKDTSQ